MFFVYFISFRFYFFVHLRICFCNGNVCWKKYFAYFSLFFLYYNTRTFLWEWVSFVLILVLTLKLRRLLQKDQSDIDLVFGQKFNKIGGDSYCSAICCFVSHFIGLDVHLLKVLVGIICREPNHTTNCKFANWWIPWEADCY